ncbi:hypothetical protein ACI797_08660 [Geodermatophilus sp. SYSU D00691]
MTTTYSPGATPGAELRPRRYTALAVVGSIMILIGGIAGTVAAAVLVAFGSSGTLDSGRNQVSTPTTALVTDVASMENVHGIGGVTGWPTLHMSATSAGPAGVFIGIGPADAVADYLSGIAVDRVTDFSVSPFELQVSREPGTGQATPPADEDFWVASATSHSTADLTWPVQDGDYRLVVMNADGSSGLTSLAQVQLELPNAFPLSLGVLAGSGVVAAVGVGLVTVAITRRRGPTTP